MAKFGQDHFGIAFEEMREDQLRSARFTVEEDLRKENGMWSVEKSREFLQKELNAINYWLRFLTQEI